MTQRPLTIYWRGALAGCNYDCAYCPFAKRRDSRETLTADRAALGRFVSWVSGRCAQTSILFTPWGEALIRRYYRDAMISLSHAAHVETVAIQTNLSCSLDWVRDCDLGAAAFWATWHPSEIDRRAFVDKIYALEALGARYSVGVVGVPAHFDDIKQLRAELPASAYLWINAEEALQERYAEAEIERLVAIDPLFELNNRRYASFGQACAAGETAIFVRADGEVRRCHFIEAPIGNIFDEGFEASLVARPCARASCNCHIGYSQMRALDFSGLFGPGLIERRAVAPQRGQAQARLQAAAHVSTAGR
jgi:MoaA/NifB/PqqE/SkfB family radical SAM enzyme